LLTAVLARQAAAAVGVGTCWPWVTACCYVGVCSAAQGTLAPTAGREGRGHIGHPPTTCSRTIWVSRRYTRLRYDFAAVRGDNRKLQSDHHHQHNGELVTRRIPFLHSRPNNSVKTQKASWRLETLSETQYTKDTAYNTLKNGRTLTTSCAGGRHNMPPPMQVDL